MRQLTFLLALAAAAPAVAGPVQDGGYHILKTAKVGGDGGFDYVYADAGGRRLYIARSGPTARVSVFDLDTWQPVTELAKINAHGVAVDFASHHGFASSRPVAMWDTTTMAPIKKITVDGKPDGIMNDDFNHRTYVFSHTTPNATVIDARTGSVLGTIDLGGAPEQAVTDGVGHVFVDLEDKNQVAVIDAATMKVNGTYDLGGKAETPAGLAIDAANEILFVACRKPNRMVILDATNGNYLADLPLGRGCDGAAFNPKTMECFSSQGDGTLTVIKENSRTSFDVQQTVKTMSGAKTMTLDPKTGQIYLIAAEYGPPEPAPNGRTRRPMLPGSFSIIVVGK